MLAIVISVVASLIHVYAFIIYNNNQISKEGKPSIVSWFLWAAAASINFFSYKEMSEDIVLSLLPATGSAMCVITFLITLFKGKFKKPGKGDYFVLSVGVLSIFLWNYFDSAMIANFMMLFGGLIAFFPTYQNIIEDSKAEPPKPWFIWTIAFFLGAVVVVLKWDGDYENLAYPVLSGFGHLFIAIFSTIRISKTNL